MNYYKQLMLLKTKKKKSVCEKKSSSSGSGSISSDKAETIPLVETVKILKDKPKLI